jgi:lipopolysaccharide/colanic/teichoic acid biosynthesis glycosyltransferase
VNRSSNQKKGITPIAIGGSLLIAAIGAAQLLSGRVYYPHVVVEAVENVRLEFLQEGLAKGEDCDAATAAIVDAIRASCPTCRVATQQCPDRLEPRYEKLLSEEPVAMPSSRLPHGVVAYVSDNKGLALAACSESERLTGASPGFRAVCHQPNTPRPMPGSSNPQLADMWPMIFSPPAFLLFGLAFAGFFFVRFAALHTRWGALAHGYFPSRLRTGLVKPLFIDGNDVLRFRNRFLKRSFDILVTAILLFILTPVFLCAAVLLLLTQGRPIFYVSTRYIGLNRPVRVIKFRTMVRDASSPKHRLGERFMRDGYLDIPLDCEVYTPVGRILERLQIVELPQILNVLIDGMSLVGNRPLPKENVELLAQFPGWEKRFESPGGITGISQVVGKLNLTPAKRLRLESLYSRVYQEGNIIWCDCLIIWHTTAGVLLRNEGITLERSEALLRSCLPEK